MSVTFDQKKSINISNNRRSITKARKSHRGLEVVGVLGRPCYQAVREICAQVRLAFRFHQSVYLSVYGTETDWDWVDIDQAN